MTHEVAIPQDPKQRDDMLDDFKKSFVRLKPKKKEKEKEIAEEELLKEDFRTLINRFVDPKVNNEYMFIFSGVKV